MSVDTTHTEYDSRAPQWQRMRDVLAGSDAVKAAGSAYLPTPSGMDSHEANGYRTRALFYNATARTLQGLVGAIFRKPLTIANWPESKSEQEALDDVTGTGIGIEPLAQTVTAEIISVGRAGAIVDKAVDGEGDPYIRLYRAEDIINWRSEFLSGQQMLLFVVLREIQMVPDPDDPFKMHEVDTRLVLELAPETGFYRQTRWKKSVKTGTNAEEWAVVEVIDPVIFGKSLEFIPFQFFGPDRIDTSIAKAPLLDLADVNLSHYRTSADLEHGAHFTGLPTPWIAGRPIGENVTLRIGSGTAWVLDTDSKVGMLEYTGEGLGALEKGMDRKESLMAVLGARLLEERKAAVEAADTLRLRGAGENSILATVANTISRGLENVLDWLALWRGRADAATTVELNTDFFDQRLDPTELSQLVTAWQGGAIGSDALFHNLNRGEMLPEGMTREEFDADLAENSGLMGGLMGDPAALGGPGGG